MQVGRESSPTWLASQTGRTLHLRSKQSVEAHGQVVSIYQIPETSDTGHVSKILNSNSNKIIDLRLHEPPLLRASRINKK